MAQSSITIKINQPCGEDFNSMPVSAQGHYCARCEKYLTDFSSWSTDELVGFIQQHKKNIGCGRFNEEQLNRAFPILESKPTPFFWQKWAAVALLFPMLNSAFAQASSKKIGKPIIQAVAVAKPMYSGRVLLNNVGVAAIKVFIPETNDTLVTDNNGVFRFTLSDTIKSAALTFELPEHKGVFYTPTQVKVNDLKQQGFKLIINCYPLKELETSVIEEKIPPMVYEQVIIQGGFQVYAGIPEIIETPIKKRSIWYRLVHLRKNKTW